jgi:hypothetical protein
MLMKKNKSFFHSTFSDRTSFLTSIPVAKGMDSKSIIHYLLDFMIFVQKEDFHQNWLKYLLRIDTLSLTTKVKKEEFDGLTLSEAIPTLYDRMSGDCDSIKISKLFISIKQTE